ncbi:MAG: hypothetical protein ACX94D_14045 [Henriciella sp.]
MSKREEIIAYWLVPTAEHTARFQCVVDALADQQGAPRFHPHLSFGSLTDTEPDLDEVLQLLSGLELSPTEVAQSPSYTMSFFVRFEPTEQVLRARAAFEARPGFRASRAFDPHISLCYGTPKNRGELQAEINALLERPVQFDRLIATNITLPVQSHADVELWTQRAVHQIPNTN